MYKLFLNWLFDGNINSPIPTNTIPDLLKYNNPINHLYLIKLFIKCSVLNNYFNRYLNNLNLFAIPKEELFLYIKKCIIKNNIRRNQIHYSMYRNKNKLFNILSYKFPYLKSDEILMMCEKINSSNEKKDIYNSLGLVKTKKERVKNNKSLNSFLQNFSIIMY